MCTAPPAGSRLDGTLAWPGLRLADAPDAVCGEGVHRWDTGLHASIAGTVSLDRSCEPPRLSVSALTAPSEPAAAPPTVGDIVTCRVIRINPRLASLEILCVAGVPLREPCGGLLRREDVREFERDAVLMRDSCRPGDIVQARVLSLGDSRAYYVTTASEELGVVFARSAEDGSTLLPLAWDEMLCPATHAREARKVARPARPASTAV